MQFSKVMPWIKHPHLHVAKSVKVSTHYSIPSLLLQIKKMVERWMDAPYDLTLYQYMTT